MKTILTLTAACLVVLATTPAHLHAATLTVTSAADSGPGSLRTALKNSRNGDTIQFSLPASSIITLTSGELLVSKNLQILGPGAGNLAISGSHASRVFRIDSRMTVTIAGLTIANGVAPFGGGIYSDRGTLMVSNCIVTGNSTTSGSGGGIYSDGSIRGSVTLTVVDSIISGNSAYAGGGGLSSGAATATTIINNCTFYANSSSHGGAVYLSASTLTMANCTLSANSSMQGGGILNNNGTLTVLNSTLKGNADDYGCIVNVGSRPSLTIGSTILDNNAFLWGEIVGGSVMSLGYNLCSHSASVLTRPTDQINTDPLLGPLQDNGGPAFTHAALPGSPAIDQGYNFSGSATDQRGFFRSIDFLDIANAPGADGTDIGALEVQ